MWIRNNKASLVLWKHYLIRKRHWFLTLVEVCLPILLFLLLAYARSQIDMVMKTNETETIHEPENLEYLDTLNTKILYSPKNNVTERIIHRLQEFIQMPTSNVLGFDSENDLVTYYTAKNEDAVFGIVFNSLTPKFDYKFRIHEKGVYWRNRELYDARVYEAKTSVYRRTKFLTLQNALDMAFIEDQGNVTLNYRIEMKAMPFPPRIEDRVMSQLYENFFPHITIFSFLFMIPAVVQRVVEEKKSGIKELQKIVGLKDWMLWLGWFSHGIVPAIISIITIVILMKVPFWGVEYPPIEYSNGVIYFMFLLLYAISTICFCFFVSTITDRPTFSMVFAILIWLFSYFIPSSVIEANGSTKFIKAVFWMFPNIVLSEGYKIMQIYEQKEIGFQWSNFCELPLMSVHNFRVCEIFLLFIIEAVFFTIISLYLDNINPGAYGVRQSIFFPFRKLKKMFRLAEVGYNIHDAEEANLLKPGIQLINLTKNFGSFKAVDDVSLDIYKDQITTLLGHNGAGKTTLMHMLTGMIEASSGNVIIDNKNVKTDMDEIRTKLGLCPQHNLLFQDFTVLEHLLFFAMLRGQSRKSAECDANILLRGFNLSDKKYVLASTLSGGMKRKLCLGMAMIGNPKVLILDEPTSGMDPESRRAVWDMLLKSRGSKTILLTTHFLEEADVLGDWIAIMSHGKVLCHGTPLELKKQFHTGYHLTLSIQDDDYEKQDIEMKINDILTRELTNVEPLKSFGKTMAFNLRIEDKKRFPGILNELEEKKEEFKIENCSLQLTTLEDVFLKTMEIDELNHLDPDENAFSVTLEYEKRLPFLPMMKKRLCSFKRRFWHYIVTVLLVALLLFGVASLCQNYLFGANYDNEPYLDLNLKTYGRSSVYVGGDIKQNIYGNITEAYKNVIQQQGSKAIQVDQVDESVIQAAIKDVEYYKQSIVAGVNFENDDRINVFYSYRALHSAPVSLNLFSNAVLKTFLGDKYSIAVSAHPLVPLELIGDKPKMVSESQVRMIWTCLFPIGLILLLCPFIVFPFEELSSKFTSIQFMSGISPSAYWTTNVFGDTLILVLQVILIVFLQLFQFVWDFNIFYTSASLLTFIIMVLIMTVSSLPYAYLFSRKKTLSGGVAFFIILNIFMGTILYIVVTLLQTFGNNSWKCIGDFSDVILLLFCPSYGFAKIGNYFAQQTTRKYNWVEMTKEERKIYCTINANNPCCFNDVPQCEQYTSFLGAPSNTFVRDLILMVVGMIFYLLFNVVLDNNYISTILHKIKLSAKKAVSPIDSDFELCDSPVDRNNDEGYNFKATLLKKTYNKVVVNIKQIFVPKGKCYGFLGVNGAGKTTTFNLLTKQIMNDNPKGYMSIGGKFSTKNSSWYSYLTKDDQYLNRLGYCPQADLLNFTLTGKELLTFIAEIRGVKHVTKVVDDFIQMFDLTEYQDKMIKTYSGGNKRKVCIAIAFLGIQDVVLLDEPTSGVDAGSKRNFWRILKNFQYKNNLTTILTSHSMNECEALCDRLLIMKDAEIKKNETISRLKQEISGYTVNFKFKSDKYDETDSANPNKNNPVQNLAKFKEQFEATFKNNECKITDEHIGSLQYHVKSDKLSKLFGQVELIKQNYDNLIEDYSISESSVEDIFLKVARENNT